MMKTLLPLGNKKIELYIEDERFFGEFWARFPSIKYSEEKIIREAIGDKLEKMLSPRKKVAIVVDDITRPTPTRLIIKILGETLERVGLPWEQVEVVFAYGAHRPHTEKEIDQLLGKDRPPYKIVHHDAKDKEKLVFLGKTQRGTPLWINKNVVEADIRILSGSIKPHNQAGFTGGGKAVVPGCAGLETIITNHGFENVAHSLAILGALEGNPIREDIEEVLSVLGPCFLINVILDKEKNVFAAVGGDPLKAHREGCESLMDLAEVTLSEPVDVVVVGCPPPIDISLYQAMNALTAPVRVSRPVLKKGGTIILVAECREKYGQKEFFDLVKSFDNPESLLADLESSEIFRPDQYAAQIWGTTVRDYRVMVYSPNLDRALLEKMHAEKIDDIQKALKETSGKVAVFPEAPYCIPNLELAR